MAQPVGALSRRSSSSSAIQPEILVEHVVEQFAAGWSAQSASACPQTTAFGEEAYPDLHAKAAALLHSLARNHPLIDGNKRLALAATLAFFGVNGMRLILTNDQAYELVVDVARGELDDVTQIAAVLATGTAPRA